MASHALKKDALLASDMDGTVIPLKPNPEREAEIKKFNHLFQKHSNVALAYVTGRHLELGLAGVNQYHLPMPDIFVCDVGTTIYFRSRHMWRKDENFRLELRRSWQGLSGADIARLLFDMPDLAAQEDEKQKEFKQSYYASMDMDCKEIAGRIHDRLNPRGIKANVIYSVDAKKNVGLVDVLPEIAAKDHALRYLWQRLGLEKDLVVYAGDSGNDLLVFVSGFNAIVVNNTAEAVKREVRRQAQAKSIEDRIYFAAGTDVQGVMEGCFHFKIFPAP